MPATTSQRALFTRGRSWFHLPSLRLLNDALHDLVHAPFMKAPHAHIDNKGVHSEARSLTMHATFCTSSCQAGYPHWFRTFRGACPSPNSSIIFHATTSISAIRPSCSALYPASCCAYPTRSYVVRTVAHVIMEQIIFPVERLQVRVPNDEYARRQLGQDAILRKAKKKIPPSSL